MFVQPEQTTLSGIIMSRLKRTRKGPGLMIGVRCQDDLLAELDIWRRQQIVVPSRAAALRRLAEIGMRHLRLASEAK
jgi:hypothetical protein